MYEFELEQRHHAEEHLCQAKERLRKAVKK
jgi:hypothetical protein